MKPLFINPAIKWNWAVNLIASPPNHVYPVKRKVHGASADLDLWRRQTSLLLPGIESESISNPARYLVKLKICQSPYAGSCRRCWAWQSVVAVLNPLPIRLHSTKICNCPWYSYSIKMPKEMHTLVTCLVAAGLQCVLSCLQNIFTCDGS